MIDPVTTPVQAAGVGLFFQVVGGLLTIAVTGLVGNAFRTNSRVTTLEAERVNLVNLEKLMTAKYDALAELIDLKFEHLNELIRRGLISSQTHPVRHDVPRDK